MLGSLKSTSLLHPVLSEPDVGPAVLTNARALETEDFGHVEGWKVVALVQKPGHRTDFAHLVFSVRSAHDTVEATQVGMII